MTEKTTLPAIPALNKADYEVSDTTWTALRSEIVRLTTLINAGNELAPADVTNVKALAKQVRGYGVLYRRAITTSAAKYKQRLDQELANLGYDVIERYVDAKRVEQQNAISQRLTAKITHFNQLVQTELAKTQVLKNSALASYAGNNLLSRFPKVNSGALSKEITNWQPIASVIRVSLMRVDQLMLSQPALVQMPVTAQSLRALSDYLATGDIHKTEHLEEALKADLPILQQLALKPRVTSDESTVNEIKTILATPEIDAKTKLDRIQLVLQVYHLSGH